MRSHNVLKNWTKPNILVELGKTPESEAKPPTAEQSTALADLQYDDCQFWWHQPQHNLQQDKLSSIPVIVMHCMCCVQQDTQLLDSFVVDPKKGGGSDMTSKRAQI